MPTQSTIVKDKLVPLQPTYTNGLPVWYGQAPYKNGDEAAFFSVCTGTTLVPDATPGQSANVTLIPDSAVPTGMRCYLTEVTFDVLGYVNWSLTSPTAGAVPYLALIDSLGVPGVVCPFNSLKGNADLYFPSPDVDVPLVLGPSTVNGPVGIPVTTFTINTAQTQITAGAAVFVSGLGVGSPIRVIDGTGKGQAAFITAISSTTVCTISPAFATTLDSTSVIAIDYQSLSAYGSTTSITLQNGGGTPFTANAFDNGFNVIGVNGAGVGAVRPISVSTTAGALTLPYALNNAMNTTTTLIQLSNNTELNGAVDCCVGDKWATLSLNRGLQLAVNLQSGTSPLGSACRVYAQGFFAA